jgi:uncharacterized membrane protein YiaA
MFISKSIYLSAIIRVIKGVRTGMALTQKGDLKMRPNTLPAEHFAGRPTAAYIGASWAALAIGVIAYLFGLYNSELALNEKGFYLAVFLFAMFSSVTIQKTVRDVAEGLPATKAFLFISWASFSISIALLAVGLYNAELKLSEKGFFGMAFVLSLFAVITVQKNIRDMTNKKGKTLPEVFPAAVEAADSAAEAVGDLLD